MLSGRCWGVAIDDVSDRGGDAEVLAIGAGIDPRPLRAIATDPNARRTDYPVGSPAWVRLLANGGREDISGLWHGIEREPVDAPVVVASLVVEKAARPAVEEEAASEPAGARGRSTRASLCS
jgi:hypothetical protein